MTKEIERTMGIILKEFEIIKNTLKPVIEETKKSKETKIELERTKRNLESRLKKLEFENRRIAQRPELSRDVSVLRDRITQMQKDLLNAKKSSGTDINEIKKIMREIVTEEELLTDVQKSSITRLRKKIKELDKNHLTLISATREKITGVLTELSKSNEHKEQIVSELNKHKKVILKLKDENKRIADKATDLTAVTSRIEKKQASESGDIKNRMHKLDKKMMTQKDLTELKNGLNALKEKVFGEVGSLKHQFKLLEGKIITKKELDNAVKASIKKENTAIENAVKNMKENLNTESVKLSNKMQKTEDKISKEIELLKNRTSEVVKELDRITIKVENTSKIISEMEKVL